MNQFSVFVVGLLSLIVVDAAVAQTPSQWMAKSQATGARSVCAAHRTTADTSRAAWVSMKTQALIEQSAANQNNGNPILIIYGDQGIAAGDAHRDNSNIYYDDLAVPNQTDAEAYFGAANAAWTIGNYTDAAALYSLAFSYFQAGSTTFSQSKTYADQAYSSYAAAKQLYMMSW